MLFVIVILQLLVIDDTPTVESLHDDHDDGVVRIRGFLPVKLFCKSWTTVCPTRYQPIAQCVKCRFHVDFR